MIVYFYSEKEKFKNNTFNYPVKALKSVCQKVKRHILKNRGSTIKYQDDTLTFPSLTCIEIMQWKQSFRIGIKQQERLLPLWKLWEFDFLSISNKMFSVMNRDN